MAYIDRFGQVSNSALVATLRTAGQTLVNAASSWASAAAGHAADAEASAQLARDISNIAVPDDTVHALIEDPTSQTSDALHSFTAVVVDERNVREDVTHHGFSAAGSASANAAAITAALAASSRPLWIPGAPGTVYTTNQITSLPSGRQMLGEGATLRSASGTDSGVLYLTAVADFGIDGLIFDGNDLASSAVRFIDCTGFHIGSAKATKGYRAGWDFQECLDFTADTLVADDNGVAAGTVGSGVYLREKTGGSGSKQFSIGKIIGSGNGLGAGLDGDTAHTSGSACTGQIGQIIARNNTRYGVKFQHTGGLLQVGSIYASGNVNGFSCPAVNGLEVGQIWAEDNTGTGAWFDAACQNVHVGKLVSLRSGAYGAQIVAGAQDVTLDAVQIKQAGLTQPGSSGRGFDVRGVTRLQVGRLKIVDAGNDAPNTTNEALYVDGANCTDVQFGDVILTDTRAGTARAAYPANFSGATFPKVTVGTLRASNFQNKDIQALPGVQFGRVVVDDKYAYRRSSAVIPAGSTNVFVTHNLIRTPTFAAATSSDSNTMSVVVDTIGSSTFRLRASAAPAADLTVFWEAGLAQ